MSDFLSHLAAKNLNLAPVIQPRPLSLFEPSAARSTSVAGPRLPAEALDISDAVESDTPRTLRPTSRPIVAARPDPIDPQTRLDESGSRQPPLTPPSRIEPLTITPQLPERHRDVPREIVNVTNIQSVVERPMAHTVTTERLVVEKERVTPDRATAPIEVEPTAESSSVNDHAMRSSRPIVTPLIERVVHERSDSGQSQAIQTDLPRRDTTSPLRSAEPPSATEAPTIHVTIGRIEVRATSPAAPAKQAPRSASTLSLDDYLRSRDGGKR